MKPNFKPWLLLGVIFILGAVTGSALTFGWSAHYRHVPGAHDMKKHWMDRLTHELSLSSDQQAKIDPIVTDAVTKFQALHRNEMENGAQIFKSTDEQISAVLTPDQKTQLQKMESDREKMFGSHSHHHAGSDDVSGSPPPPPPGAPPPPPNP